MSSHESILSLKTPRDCAPSELQSFRAMLVEGGQVASQGLSVRISRALRLAFLRDGEHLVGIAGIKLPNPAHKKHIWSDAGLVAPMEAYPYELGWVFVSVAARGRRLSSVLCKALLDTVPESGVYATSTTGNIAMHLILESLRFRRMSDPFRSRRSEHDLIAFALTRTEDG